jgi:hypothetical protein
VRRLRAADLKSLHVPLAKVLPFVELADHRPGRELEAPRPQPVQAGLFDEMP